MLLLSTVVPMFGSAKVLLVSVCFAFLLHPTPGLSASEVRSGQVDVRMVVGEPINGNTSTGSLFGGFEIVAHIVFDSNYALLTQSFIPEKVTSDVESAFPVSFEVTTILDGRRNVAYVLDRETKTAMKLDISEASYTTAGQIGNPLDILTAEKYPEGAEIEQVGKKTYRGKSYKAFRIRFTVAGLESDSEVLVNEDMLPVFMRGTYAGLPFSAEYTGYKFYKPDPRIFQLPKDYEVIDMLSLFRGKS